MTKMFRPSPLPESLRAIKRALSPHPPETGKAQLGLPSTKKSPGQAGRFFNTLELKSFNQPSFFSAFLIEVIVSVSSFTVPSTATRVAPSPFSLARYAMAFSLLASSSL